MPRKKIPQKEFERRIQERFPEENFEIIQYESLGMPAVILCKECNNEINISKATNFLAKNKRYGCVNCHGLWKNRELILEKIKDKYDILKNEILKNGKSTKRYYTIQCKKCGHIRRDNLQQLNRHLNCGCETGMFKWGVDDFKNQFTKKFPQYQIIENYKGMHEKHLIRHKCGFIFKTRLSDFYYADKDSHVCPKCQKELLKISKGHRKVREILEQLNINFDEEYKLNNSLLRFDFYFKINNFEFAIEYNGKQHYQPVEFFGGEEQFQQQLERDERKRKYCNEKGINLLEIKYDIKLDDLSFIISDFISSTTTVVQVDEKAL